MTLRKTVLRKVAAMTLASAIALSATPLFPMTALAVGSNGSFEMGTDPGVYATLNPGDANITGWIINSGTVDYIGTYWQASNGTRSIDMNGTSAGSISQVLTTVIGATYDITFAMSGNPDGAPALKELSVSATGAAPQNYTFDTGVAANTLGAMGWVQKTYSFVATAVSTTLTFTSQITGSFGPALDNVAITETIPVVCATPVMQTKVSDTTNNTVASGGSPAVSVVPHVAWTASIPGSTTWIWETGPTAVDEIVAFEQSFTISGTVLSAALDIAADNSYEVFIDGVSVALDANENNFQVATQDSYNLTANVTPGAHILRIAVKNLGAYDASANPAGVLYKFVVNSCGGPAVPPQNACATPTVAPAGYTLQNGTSGSDTVVLSPNTMFVGKGGNDTITAPDGNYIICLKSGNDKVTLANGNYAIDAGGGNNTIVTGNGDGSIISSSGNDKVTTGDGAHTINAAGGNNTITTGNGTQSVTTGSGNDTITTGSGNDTIAAGGGNNTVTSGAGDDSITATSGNDIINGGANYDTCSAGGGFNTVTNCEA